MRSVPNMLNLLQFLISSCNPGRFLCNAFQLQSLNQSHIRWSDKNSSDQETTDENEASDSSTESNENTDSFSPIGDSLAIDFDITAEPTDFPKDTTGKWRKTMIAESGIEFQNYALNYYKKYFKSNDEVHVIYNFSTRTVTCITCMGNLLSVRVMDYVDKEEHDASAACGGTLLAEYQVNIETGAIEKIQ